MLKMKKSSCHAFRLGYGALVFSPSLDPPPPPIGIKNHVHIIIIKLKWVLYFFILLGFKDIFKSSIWLHVSNTCIF